MKAVCETNYLEGQGSILSDCKSNRTTKNYNSVYRSLLLRLALVLIELRHPMIPRIVAYYVRRSITDLLFYLFGLILFACVK